MKESKLIYPFHRSLKPVGLNFMLNTNCGVLQGRKRSDYHRRRSKLHVYVRTAPARQSKYFYCISFEPHGYLTLVHSMFVSAWKMHWF